MNVTVPVKNSDYLVGATIPATATVASGTPDYSVVFTLDSVPQDAVTLKRKMEIWSARGK